MIQQTKIKDQYRQFDSALISFSGHFWKQNYGFWYFYFSEKRLEKIRPKNECDEDVGSLSLPNCIKVTVTILNFVTIMMSPLWCHQKNYLANLRRSFLRRSPNDENLFPINKFKIATSRSKKCWSQRRKKWRKESLSRYKYVPFSKQRTFRKWKNYRNDENFEKSTYSRNRPFWVVENFDASAFSKKWRFRGSVNFEKLIFRKIDVFEESTFSTKLYFSDARSSSTAVQSGANNG